MLDSRETKSNGPTTRTINDEIVHTGFHKMANYLFAIGCWKR